MIALASWLRPNPLITWVLPVLGALLVVLLIQVDFGTDVPDNIDHFDSSSWLAEPLARSEWLMGLYTALVYALALGTVVAGQRFRQAALVNVGVAVVAVLTIAVYIGRVAGELPTSIAVLVGGILLVAGAVVLERKRRDLIAEVSA